MSILQPCAPLSCIVHTRNNSNKRQHTRRFKHRLYPSVLLLRASVSAQQKCQAAAPRSPRRCATATRCWKARWAALRCRCGCPRGVLCARELLSFCARAHAPPPLQNVARTRNDVQAMLRQVPHLDTKLVPHSAFSWVDRQKGIRCVLLRCTACARLLALASLCSPLHDRLRALTTVHLNASSCAFSPPLTFAHTSPFACPIAHPTRAPYPTPSL